MEWLLVVFEVIAIIVVWLLRKNRKAVMIVAVVCLVIAFTGFLWVYWGEFPDTWWNASMVFLYVWMLVDIVGYFLHITPTWYFDDMIIFANAVVVFLASLVLAIYRSKFWEKISSGERISQTIHYYRNPSSALDTEERISQSIPYHRNPSSALDTENVEHIKIKLTVNVWQKSEKEEKRTEVHNYKLGEWPITITLENLLDQLNQWYSDQFKKAQTLPAEIERLLKLFIIHPPTVLKQSKSWSAWQESGPSWVRIANLQKTLSEIRDRVGNRQIKQLELLVNLITEPTDL